MQQEFKRMAYLLTRIPGLLSQVPDDIFSLKPTPDEWSRKEILGHLVDSAANNHHRFVRGQFEEVPVISYPQNEWNKFGYYQQINKQQLIEFWTSYNKQILALVSCIPEASLGRLCNTGDPEPHTLQFVFEDYVKHLEHHLKQIVHYEF